MKVARTVIVLPASADVSVYSAPVPCTLRQAYSNSPFTHRCRSTVRCLRQPRHAPRRREGEPWLRAGRRRGFPGEGVRPPQSTTAPWRPHHEHSTGDFRQHGGHLPGSFLRHRPASTGVQESLRKATRKMAAARGLLKACIILGRRSFSKRERKRVESEIARLVDAQRANMRS